MNRILICGSRDWNDLDFFYRAMTHWLNEQGKFDILIEGCARGADQMAGHLWANSHSGVTVLHFPANWDRYGKAAGTIRNQQMLTEGRPDAVIAFSKDLAHSRGTADMVRRARQAGVPVWIPYPQGA